MRKENILVVVLVIIALAGVGIYFNARHQDAGQSAINSPGNSGQRAGVIAWQAYETGMSLAKTEDKPIFLYFHAEWCSYCTKLKKTTFKNKDVLEYLSRNFISISVDTDKKRELAVRWKVKGLPTLWFLKPDGSKISSIPGYVDAKQMINILKYINTKSYETITFNDFVKTL